MRTCYDLKKAASILLSISMLASLTPLTTYAETVSDGVTPKCDEAFYGTLDYYGNLTDSSVVKSYTLNGAKTITDYGDYTSVSNLTDSTEPVLKGGETTFTFDNAPNHFYFEGKTDKPFKELPWNVAVNYKLNGVPKKAEELAGQKGEVEMTIDCVPNKSASEYMQNNYTMEAVAAFNLNDVLSVDAPDAQMVTMGNIQVAAFVVLPGAEEHFTLRVGADEFKFNGLSFLMSPVNSGKLSKINDLKDTKKDIEDSYNAFNDAFDEVLNSMDTMKSSLNEAADGLDTLNKARANVHSEKNEFYSDFDNLNGSLDGLAASMEPISGHITAAQNFINTSRQNLTDINTQMLTLRDDLNKTESDISTLKKDMQHAQDLTGDLDDDAGRLKNDISSLEASLTGAASTSSVDSTITQMQQLYQYYYTPYIESLGASPSDALDDGSFDYYETTVGTYSDAQKGTLPDGSVINNIKGGGVGTITYNPTSFEYYATQALKKQGMTSDQIAVALAIWENRNVIKTGESSTSGLTSEISTVLDDVRRFHDSDLFDIIYDITDDSQPALDHTLDLVKDLQTAIDKVDTLHTTVDNYIPEVQSALDDANNLSASVQRSVRTLSSFLYFTEKIMKKNSDQVNNGGDSFMTGLGDTFRKVAVTINSTDKMRTAQDTLKNLIDSKWDKYTGEENNLLKMDPDAKPESLTSDKNTEISSVSVLLRTAEIKVDDDKASENSTKKTDTRSVGERIGTMFSDLWHGFTSIFTGKKK